MNRRLAVLAGCVVVALLTAWYAGSRFEPATPGPTPGSVRLGPEAGEPVADYLARLPAALPPPGAPAYALVQFRTEQTGPAALAAVDGTGPVSAVFRVPVERVQTALRFEGLGTIDLARSRAAAAAADEAARLTGRPAAIAAAEARALADPGCACVVALLVRGDRAALDALAAREQVRAVDAAPADAQPVELALSPLLPAQTDAADPPPDDGDPPPP
ncbi:hypothetical protein GCM10017691_22620 [Pseudonocardia petroleophila]|uniref:Uncharacterized protein n=1 Tax=Pseudonocardia petroleophila TaxID=37331 RepID=A0A7G7MG71_9PSEU|nr:hypothetical protein [Pseudonocardia petroleophila]QNG51782.1 hypothetical protein H6H00_27385 [Pseudonocardia petroleophila]